MATKILGNRNADGATLQAAPGRIWGGRVLRGGVALALGAVLGGGAVGVAEAQNKAPAKKAPAKPKKQPEWHGEATPREVVPGEKVLIALLELGSQRMAAGKYNEALQTFSDAASRAPLEPKPLYMRGSCYQKMGRLKEAEVDFRRALELDPRGSDPQTVLVRSELGAVLTDSGRPGEAVEVLDAAVRIKPDLFEAQFNLGVAHEALKHWPEAIDAYQKAVKLKPSQANPRSDVADAQLNLGVVLRRAGRLEEAIAPAREAMQLAPDRPQPHLNLGLLLSDAKRYDEAVAELTAATQLADTLYKNGATPAEREEGKQILHKAWWRLGVVHLRREQVSSAVNAFEQANSVQPSAELLTELGMARRKAGDVPRSLTDFRAALQQNPQFHLARLHLATTLATTGNCDEGLRELAQVPADPTFVETINRVKARCDYERDMAKRARGIK